MGWSHSGHTGTLASFGVGQSWHQEGKWDEQKVLEHPVHCTGRKSRRLHVWRPQWLPRSGNSMVEKDKNCVANPTRSVWRLTQHS